MVGAEPKKRRRAKLYSDAQIVDALVASAGVASDAARRLRCNRDTIDKRIKSVDACKAAQVEGKEVLKDEAEVGLRGAVKRGEAWAICFVLKTIGRDRGYSERDPAREPQPTGRGVLLLPVTSATMAEWEATVTHTSAPGGSNAAS